MEIEREAGEIRATDEATNSVRLAVSGFEPTERAPSVSGALSAVETGPSEPTASLAGRTRRVSVRPMYVVVIDTATGTREQFGNSRDRIELPDGEYLVRIDGNVRAFVRFSGAARLTRDGPERKALAFDDARPVSIGFESRVDLPEQTVRVEPTPAGAAAAVTASSATVENTSPDRTWPSVRNHPPLVEVGETTTVPEPLRERRPDTDIEVVVPPRFDPVFTTAPLARYLGADVITDADCDPHLSVAGDRVPLGGRGGLERRTAQLLERVFYLDCVARGAGPHGGELAVSDTFDTLGLDAERLYEAPLARRVSRYLDVPFDAVRDRFPEWHLAMYVDPGVDHVTALPYLLDDLPVVCTPDSRDLDKKDWLELTVSDGFDAPREHLADGGYRVRREVSNVDLVEPELTTATTHGWMADQVPIDVFKTFPEAYQHRFDYLDDESELQVTAVVNDRDMPLLLSDDEDAAMRDEHTAAISHYRDRAKQLPIDITVRENVTTAELARVFESRTDLVHYIGHRDDRGLECANGYFSADTLTESNAQTFFLNACGSYPEGRALVKKGSVAGGITYERVADDDAATVGVTFARLLMLGFCIERALAKSSYQTFTPKDYAVVGDGTHRVAQSDSIIPPDVWLSDDDDGFSLVLRQASPSYTGGRGQWEFEDTYHLWGAACEYTLTRQEVVDYLDVLESPIIYENELWWPAELRGTL